MITIFEIDGDPDERFVMTRAQVRRLVTSAYAFGEDREPMQKTFEAECEVEQIRRHCRRCRKWSRK